MIFRLSDLLVLCLVAVATAHPPEYHTQAPAPTCDAAGYYACVKTCERINGYADATLLWALLPIYCGNICAPKCPQADDITTKLGALKGNKLDLIGALGGNMQQLLAASTVMWLQDNGKL